MSAKDDHIAAQGKLRTVEFAVRDDGTMPAKVYLDSLPKKVKEHLLAIFRHVAAEGESQATPAMFCRERGDIYTFKGKNNKIRLRFPCFKTGTRWICIGST